MSAETEVRCELWWCGRKGPHTHAIDLDLQRKQRKEFSQGLSRDYERAGELNIHETTYSGWKYP